MFYLKYIKKKKQSILRSRMWYLKLKKIRYSKNIIKKYNLNYFNLNYCSGVLKKKHFISSNMLLNSCLNTKLVIFKF